MIPNLQSSNLRTLLDFLNTHTNLTHDREDVNRYFEQFINYVQPTPEAEQEFRNRHCFSESVYGTLNGRDFFRQNQLSVRSKTTKTDCARGCLDPDPTIRWDIRESFSDTEHHGVLQAVQWAYPGQSRQSSPGGHYGVQ